MSIPVAASGDETLRLINANLINRNPRRLSEYLNEKRASKFFSANSRLCFGVEVVCGESFWEPREAFGTTLGVIWEAFGSIWVVLGRIWEGPGGHLGGVEAHF